MRDLTSRRSILTLDENELLIEVVSLRDMRATSVQEWGAKKRATASKPKTQKPKKAKVVDPNKPKRTRAPSVTTEEITDLFKHAGVELTSEMLDLIKPKRGRPRKKEEKINLS